MSSPPPPPLGVAGRWGSAEIAVARRFDELHQLIYVRGGIRPSNAAVEEVAKLVLIRLWSLRHRVSGLFPGGSVAHFQRAFAQAVAAPELVAVDPAGLAHPVWPAGEPFRLTDEGLLHAAAAIVSDIVDHGVPSVSDPLGAAFDALLAGRYDHAGGLGTYLTPSGVARMMAEVALSLLQPDQLCEVDDGPGFGDPYCGTGRFLVAALEVLRAAGPGDPVADRLLRRGPFGADQSPSAIAKARINLLLYGVDRPLVWTVRDSVTDSDVDGLRSPIILTNPPFGDGKYDDPDGLAATAAAIPRLSGRRRLDPSLVGLVRAVNLLSPGGVLGIVLPDGVVSSAAFSDLALDPGRPDVSLAACVSLPTATFSLSGTVAKTSAVFLRRAPRTPTITLARVEHVGFVRQGGRAAADPAGDQLPALAALIRARMSTEDGPVVVPVDAASVRSLDPSRLDPVALAARRRLTGAGGVALGELIVPVLAARAPKVTSPFVSVLHVDDRGTIDWSAAGSYQPTTPGLLVEPGRLIVSLLNPARLRAAVTPVAAQVSAEFGVFAADGDPYAVLGLLYTPAVRAQLRPLGTGTSSSRRRITAEDLLAVIVPARGAAQLEELGREVRQAVAQVDDGRRRLHRLFTAGR